MKICTLASSSKGNCTVIYTETTKILIDCGIGINELTQKLNVLGISPNQLNGVLITHEHSDHTAGLSMLTKYYKIPIYCHEDALYGIIKKTKTLSTDNFIFFNKLPFGIGDLQIQPFNLPHDVPACVGYSIYHNGVKASIATDFGHITTDILDNLIGSKFVILEANHDPEKLKANPHYPPFLKSRILGNNGHLSNEVSAQVIESLTLNNSKQILLAHLSEENNTPELAFNTIKNYLDNRGIEVGTNIKIDVASPSKMSPIFVLR